MAAPTYATDLTTINACDSNATPTAWTNLGTGSDATETDYFIHNGACVSKPFNITAGGLYTDYGSNIAFASGECYWLWAWFGAPNAMLAEASGGYQALVGSSAGNYELWNVMGSDTNPYGGWRCVPVDINNVSPDGTVGTPAGTYRIFGCYCNTSTGIGKGNPLGIDVIRRGRGELRIAAGDLANGYGTFAGAAAANDASTARWGLCQAQDGTYLIQGMLVLGYAAAVDFRDQNKVIIIANTKKVQSTFNRIEVRNASSRVDWTNINITALGTVSRGAFEMIDAADVNLDTCVFTDMDTFIFLSSASVLGCTFRRCNLVTASGADFSGSTVASSTVAADASALLWNVATDTDGKLDDMTFVRGTNSHHAIELGPNTPSSITLRGMTVSGFNASNGQTDSVIYNNSGKSITINVTGNSGTISYKNGTGASTSIVADQRTLTVEVRDEAGALITDSTEITIVRASDLTVLHHEEGSTDGNTSYTYAYSAGEETYINVVSSGLYVPKTVSPVYLINADQTVAIQLAPDRTFSNP